MRGKEGERAFLPIQGDHGAGQGEKGQGANRLSNEGRPEGVDGGGKEMETWSSLADSRFRGIRREDGKRSLDCANKGLEGFKGPKGEKSLMAKQSVRKNVSAIQRGKMRWSAIPAQKGWRRKGFGEGLIKSDLLHRFLELRREGYIRR